MPTGSGPASLSTLPLRKWAIMPLLDEGVPEVLWGDRVDVLVSMVTNTTTNVVRSGNHGVDERYRSGVEDGGTS